MVKVASGEDNKPNNPILTLSNNVNNPILTSSTDVNDLIHNSSTDINDPVLTFITEVPILNSSIGVNDSVPIFVIGEYDPNLTLLSDESTTLRPDSIGETSARNDGSTLLASTSRESTVPAGSQGEDGERKEFWTEGRKWKYLEDDSSTDDGYYVLDKMAMIAKYYEMLFLGKKPEKKSKTDPFLWPEDIYTRKPLVPYTISLSDQTTVDLVEEAIAEWKSATCIEFVEVTEENYDKFESKEILFIVNGSACIFGFGRNEGNPQFLIAVPPCLNKEEIVRGIGINLGVLYQVLRRDRDEHIKIHYDNFAWPKLPTDQWNHYSSPYDLSSVMQLHGLWATNKNLLTVTTNDIRYQGILGRSRGRLSHRDKKNVNELYGCIQSWRTFCGFRSNPCRNEGYVGSDCKCVCRIGTEGSHCEHIIEEDYYGHLLSPCSQHIEKESTIETPLYIVRIVTPDTWCVWTIKAPEGQLVELSFNHFQLNSTHSCQDSFLEIREKGKPYGSLYCEDSLADKVHLSEEDELYLYLDVRNSISQGFQAEVQFVDPENKPGRSPASRIRLSPVFFIILGVYFTLLP